MTKTLGIVTSGGDAPGIQENLREIWFPGTRAVKKNVGPPTRAALGNAKIQGGTIKKMGRPGS